MTFDFRLPNINAKTDSDKIAQISKYLYQLTEQLNFSLNSADIQTESGRSVNYGYGQGNTGTVEQTKEDTLKQYGILKSMIVKSADFVENVADKVQIQLGGMYLAKSEFGTYLTNTEVTIEGTPTGFTQLYKNTTQVVGDNLSFTIQNESYIKTGLLFYDSEEHPVYGIGIGQLIDDEIVPQSEHKLIDTEEIATTFTADEIAFWGGGVKLAYITPTKIYFPNGTLVADNAVLSGEVNASSGTIAGWKIESREIHEIGTYSIPIMHTMEGVYGTYSYRDDFYLVQHMVTGWLFTTLMPEGIEYSVNRTENEYYGSLDITFKEYSRSYGGV